MTEGEFEALRPSTRVRWVGPPACDGTILAQCWRRVLIAWDDGSTVSYPTWDRGCLSLVSEGRERR